MSDYIDRISVILGVFLVGLSILITTSDINSVNIGALLVVVLSFILLLREYILYCKEFIKEANPRDSADLSRKAREKIKEVFPASWWIASIILMALLNLFLLYVLHLFIASVAVLIMLMYLLLIVWSFTFSVGLLYAFRNGFPQWFVDIFIIFSVFAGLTFFIAVMLPSILDIHLPIRQLYTPVNITPVNDSYKTFVVVPYNSTEINGYIINNNNILLSVGIGILAVVLFLLYKKFIKP